MFSPVWLLLVLALGGRGLENSTQRRAGKMLNMFQLTRFPNEECLVSGTTVRPLTEVDV